MRDANFYTDAQDVAPEDALSFESRPLNELHLTVLDRLMPIARHKWLVVKVTGIAALIGIAISLALPVRFTSTTKLMTPQQSQSAAALLMNQLANSGTLSLAASAGSGLGLKNPNEIYIGMLNSRPVADAIIEEFGLRAVYRVRDMTGARDTLASNTVVASEKSGLLTVSVTDKDKGRAAEMANAYTRQLRVLTKNLAVTEASERRLFYEDQLKHANEELVAAALEFQQFQKTRGLVQLDAQAKSLIESLALLHAQISAKQVELQALRSSSTELNPSVQLVENQLSTLQMEASLSEQHSHAPGSVRLGLQDVASEGPDFLRAQHELQYRQLLFDLLLKQFDAARLDEAKDAAVIQVIEPAIPPDKKSSPHRSSIVLLFVILGVGGSCSYVILWDLFAGNPEMARSLVQLRSTLVSR